jgi:hypothetical protein
MVQGSYCPALCKVRVGSSLKLTSVVRDVMGKTGRTILEAPDQRQTEPAKLVQASSRSGRTSAFVH